MRMNPNQRFVVTFFLGILGIHRFIDGKLGTGLLWLLTGGLLWVGWVWDLCLAGKDVIDARGLGELGRTGHRRE
jgi:TM2 domain-containing membrane protein YozV